jgi:phospholipid/cholesterol/gamma-HCH transport system substrate-binding protein
MKDQRKTEIKVGITVIAGLLIFIWILTWAKNFSLTSTDKTLLVKFKNVAGLEIGDYVTVNGVRKGFVEDFNVQKQSVIVKLSVNNDVELKEDASFSITMLDLMGGKKVEINPGSSQSSLNYNEIHEGTFHADIPAVMSMIGTAQEDIFSALKDVRVTLTSINNYLTDRELNENLRLALTNLSEISVKLNKMIDENRQNLNELVTNTADLTRETKSFIDENKSTIKTSVQDLQSILQKTDSLVTKINTFVDEINMQQNNLGKILYDKEIYENLNKTLTRVKELTDIIIDQLKNEGINVDANVDLF